MKCKNTKLCVMKKGIQENLIKVLNNKFKLINKEVKNKNIAYIT